MALPSFTDDFPAWYQEVVRQADLAENSLVRGTMVIKPYGFGIWERIQRAVEYVPLRDAAQIDPHPGHVEPHCAGDRVEMDFIRPHAPGRRIERGAGRHPAGAARGTPQLDERSHGDIERPIARAPQVDRSCQHGEQIVAHADGFARSLGEAAHLARGAIIAHHVLELGHAGVGGARRASGDRVVPGVQDDPHRYAHV